MKTKKKLIFKNVMVGFLMCALILATLGTYAWFTDKKTYSSNNLQFGTIKLKVDGSSISGDNINVSISRKSGEVTGKIMPGDTVSLSFNVSLETGSEPAYYLVYLDGDDIFEDEVFYSDGENKVTAGATNKNAGTITTDEQHTFSFTKTISEDYETQGAKVTISLEIYAIQKANLTAEEAYLELYKKTPVVFGTGADIEYDDNFGGLSAVNSIPSWHEVITDFYKYETISFYRTGEQPTTLTLNETLTSNFDAKQTEQGLDAGKIKVYTNGDEKTELAFVADGEILAPKNSSSLFGVVGAVKGYYEGKKMLTSSDASTYFALKNINLDNFDTHKVTNMGGMFAVSRTLEAIDLDDFNTSKVVRMTMMFESCQALTSLDISSFNTSNVTDMVGMFENCSSLTTLDLSSFDTSNVTSMVSMFYSCSALTTLDLSSFDTSNVTSMMSMFYSCSALATLDLSSFDTSNVTNMGGCMFANCSSLTTLDLSSFDTSNVTDMQGMFLSCSALTTLDLSSFNTSRVTNMNSMFERCNKLTTITVSDKWVINEGCGTNKMFLQCGTDHVTVKSA